MKEHLVLSGNFSLQFNLAWCYGDAMSRNRRLFKEASVRRQLSCIIPKLGESIDWRGMPSRTKGTETLLCEHDVRNFENSCLFRIVRMPWQ